MFYRNLQRQRKKSTGERGQKLSIGFFKGTWLSPSSTGDLILSASSAQQLAMASRKIAQKLKLFSKIYSKPLSDSTFANSNHLLRRLSMVLVFRGLLEKQAYDGSNPQHARHSNTSLPSTKHIAIGFPSNFCNFGRALQKLKNQVTFLERKHWTGLPNNNEVPTK